MKTLSDDQYLLDQIQFITSGHPLVNTSGETVWVEVEDVSRCFGILRNAGFHQNGAEWLNHSAGLTILVCPVER